MNKNSNTTSLNKKVKSSKTIFTSDEQRSRRQQIEDRLLAAHLVTVSSGGIKTMVTLMLPGNLNVKLTSDARAKLEDLGYIKKLEKGHYHPVRDRTDDVVEIISTQLVRVQSETKGIQSPFRFARPNKKNGGVS